MPDPNRYSRARALFRNGPALYPLTDRTRQAGSLVAIAKEVFAGGARLLQVREKHCPDRGFLEELRAVVRLADRAGAAVIVNDRVDLAMLSDAHGVHVGEEDLSVADVRRLAGESLVVGVSTHSVAGAVAASCLPVDYIALGPIFPSETKPGREAVTLASLRSARARLTLPLVAIGGIGRENLGEVVAAGADVVAVVSAIMARPDRRAATSEMLSLLARMTSVGGEW